MNMNKKKLLAIALIATCVVSVPLFAGQAQSKAQSKTMKEIVEEVQTDIDKMIFRSLEKDYDVHAEAEKKCAEIKNYFESLTAQEKVEYLLDNELKNLVRDKNIVIRKLVDSFYQECEHLLYIHKLAPRINDVYCCRLSSQEFLLDLITTVQETSSLKQLEQYKACGFEITLETLCEVARAFVESPSSRFTPLGEKILGYKLKQGEKYIFEKNRSHWDQCGDGSRYHMRWLFDQYYQYVHGQIINVIQGYYHKLTDAYWPKIEKAAQHVESLIKQVLQLEAEIKDPISLDSYSIKQQKMNTMMQLCRDMQDFLKILTSKQQEHVLSWNNNYLQQMLQAHTEKSRSGALVVNLTHLIGYKLSEGQSAQLLVDQQGQASTSTGSTAADDMISKFNFEFEKELLKNRQQEEDAIGKAMAVKQTKDQDNHENQ